MNVPHACMRQKQFWPIIIIKNGIISIWYGRWCLFVVHDGRWRAEHIRSTQANTNVVPVPCGTRMEIEPNAKATAFESPFNRTECNANGPIHLFYLKYIYTHWVCNVCVCVVVEHQHWAGRTIIAKQTVFFSCVIWVCGVRLPDSTHYHAHSHHHTNIQTQNAWNPSYMHISTHCYRMHCGRSVWYQWEIPNENECDILYSHSYNNM